MQPASRVESDKTTPPRWKKEKDDYKADLSKYPEEIKDLCPIVITSIDCRPTRFTVIVTVRSSPTCSSHAPPA